MLLLFLNVCANREEWKQSLQFHYSSQLSTTLTCAVFSGGSIDKRQKPEGFQVLHTKESFLQPISDVIMGVLPLHG